MKGVAAGAVTAGVIVAIKNAIGSRPRPNRPTIPATSAHIIVNFHHVAQALGGRERFQEGLRRAISSSSLRDDANGAEVIARALAALEDVETLPNVLSSPDDQAGALLQTFLAEHAAATGKVAMDPKTGVFYVKYDERDVVGWLPTAWDYIKSKLGLQNRPPFQPLPNDSTRLGNRARLALLGDWGVGIYGAPVSANSISADRGGFDAIIHLGDVYYTGTANQVQQNFLNHWPRLPNVVSRACNSNHEMFGGGQPYFTMTLPDFEQSSSVFRLENDHWVLVGLDTAYDGGDLQHGQVEWLDQVVAGLEDRHLIVFSHHPLFWHQDKRPPRFASKVQHLLNAKRVYAWYWGHEHLLAIYDQHMDWGLRARCVGHGGYPYSRPKLNGIREPLVENCELVHVPAKANQVPAASILDGPNPYVDVDPVEAARYGPHGYMTLDFDGISLHESLHTPVGTAIWSKTWNESSG